MLLRRDSWVISSPSPTIKEGTPMATVAEHIITALKVSGVQRVYGLPGDSLNGFTDAIQIGRAHV